MACWRFKFDKVTNRQNSTAISSPVSPASLLDVSAETRAENSGGWIESDYNSDGEHNRSQNGRSYMGCFVLYRPLSVTSNFHTNYSFNELWIFTLINVRKINYLKCGSEILLPCLLHSSVASCLGRWTLSLSIFFSILIMNFCYEGNVPSSRAPSNLLSPPLYCCLLRANSVNHFGVLSHNLSLSILTSMCLFIIIIARVFIPPLLPYVYMARCLIKHRNNYYAL
jgi:hypothetical protein